MTLLKQEVSHDDVRLCPTVPYCHRFRQAGTPDGYRSIRTARVDALTFGLGSGIAGIAGVALSQIDNVSTNLGQGYIIDSFLVVVFGGLVNLLRGKRLANDRSFLA